MEDNPKGSKWWPDHSQWPTGIDRPSRIEGAFALLVLAGDIDMISHEDGALAMVNCSDVFEWGCADWEPITPFDFDDEDREQFLDLYEKVRTCPKWGSAQWCILRRDRQPQKPVKDAMVRDGAWLPEMDNVGVDR